MKVLWVIGMWEVRTKGEIDPQVTYSGWSFLTFPQSFGGRWTNASVEADHQR